MDAEHAVAVRVGAPAHAVEEVVAGAERQDLLHRHRLRGVGRLVLPQAVRRVDRRLVRRHRVHRVVDVLEVDLPVAADHVAQARRRRCAGALRRAVDHVVDRSAARRRSTSSNAGPAVDSLTNTKSRYTATWRSARHAAARLARFEARALVAGLQRHAHRRAVELVRPRVVRAAEVAADVAARLADEPRALVRAAVEQHADRAVGLAHHHQRAAGDLDRQVVAGFRHLARVAEVAPGVREEVLLLEREQRVAEVEVAVDPVLLDQRADAREVGHAAHRRRGETGHCTSFHWPLSSLTTTRARSSEP